MIPRFENVVYIPVNETYHSDRWLWCSENFGVQYWEEDADLPYWEEDAGWPNHSGKWYFDGYLRRAGEYEPDFPRPASFVYSFKNEADAIFFKLRWG